MHINTCWLFNAKSSLYIYIKYIWFGLVRFLWHIKRCWLFNAKSSSNISIGACGGVMVSNLDLQIYTSEFESHWVPLSYGLVPHLSKKLSKLPLHTYQIYMIWFGSVFYHINHCKLFKDISSLYKCIKYIWFWFSLVWFYGLSTIFGYSISNSLYSRCIQ